jgi:hypothetical protein
MDGLAATNSVVCHVPDGKEPSGQYQTRVSPASAVHSSLLSLCYRLHIRFCQRGRRLQISSMRNEDEMSLLRVSMHKEFLDQSKLTEDMKQLQK